MSFIEFIHANTLVFDGPMGTELYRRHVFTNRCFEELNLSESKLIEQILCDYRDAGADVVTTNTFGANRSSLEKYGLGDQTKAINIAGAKIARKVAESAERPCFVAGSIGPLPQIIQNAAGQPNPEFESLIWEQVDALVEGGVDFIMFET
ncbi:MAG: homocysteine S-methyltransferase family protein, partial [Thermoguttaceae bacterium]